jgi:integrase
VAYIKRTQKDGQLLIGYRPLPGAPECFGTVPDRQAFEQFQLLEKHRRQAGETLPNPTGLFDRPEAQAAKRSLDVTLTEWVGKPTEGRPGEFFAYASTMSENAKADYERALETYLKPLAGHYLRVVRRADVSNLVTGWLACPCCVARAKAKKVKLLPAQLAVTAEPFDGECVDEEGDSTHYAPWRRGTVHRRLQQLRALFNAGMRYEDPICTHNPVRGFEIPIFEEPPNNEDDVQALSHLQLRQLADGHPAELEALPIVTAYGLLRRSETLGLNRSDIRWPGPDDKGVATLNVRRVYVLHRSTYRLRPWGKTPSATLPVMLARPATEALRRHIDQHRSTSNPKVCPLCAAGVGEWTELTPNEHRGCDFADDAPVWVGFGGGRLHPSTYRLIFDRSLEASGLTRPALGFRVTIKVLRATGATLLLELGTPIELVKKMGRWTNEATPLRHYLRMRGEALHQAIVKLGNAADAELGLAVDDDTPPEVLLRAAMRRLETAEAETDRLRELVIALGGDPAPPALERAALRDSGVWTEEQLRAAVAGARTQKQILERLGVSLAGKHYRRLAAAAREFDLELPGSWGRAA